MSLSRDTEILRLLNSLMELTLMHVVRIDRELGELRTLLADLDDATPSRRAFEELHSRVDEIVRKLPPL